MADDLATERAVLPLALLTYRKFNEALSAPRLRDAIAEGLADSKVAGVVGHWQLVWGPECYRAPLSLFDDGLMYVARDRDRPHRYAIAIRGTNPISIFDWIWGDLWVRWQQPWAEDGDPEAKISLSTALGLGILKHMRSEPVHDSLGTKLLDLVLGAADTLKRTTAHLLGPIVAIAQRLVTERSALQVAIDDFVTACAQRPDDPSDALDALRRARQQLNEAVDRVITTLGKGPSLKLLSLLLGADELSTTFRDGQDVLTFLKAAVDQADGDPVEVVVTGHSKGGALASTFALWLADTQGRRVPAHEQWDREKRATVHCFSYAGPTAGNAAFAAHSDAMIGDRCHRVVNDRDVVPHAWEIGDLKAIPQLFEGRTEVKPLTKLLAAITEDVTEPGYRHPGKIVRRLPSAPQGKSFVGEFVYQHLEGYLHELKLSSLMQTSTFFDVLRQFDLDEPPPE